MLVCYILNAMRGHLSVISAESLGLLGRSRAVWTRAFLVWYAHNASDRCPSRLNARMTCKSASPKAVRYVHAVSRAR